jgi:hypothetical protein
MHDIIQPLISFGYARDVVSYGNWCILTLESMVALCQAKYLSWRIRLYITITRCYDHINDIQAAHRAIQRAILKV